MSVDIEAQTKRIGERKIGEEEWSERTESLAIEWGKKAEVSSEAHNKAGKSHKFKHVVVGLPSIIIPIAMAPISTTFAEEDGIEYANMSMFLISGVLSAVHTFFAFDRKYQKHMDYSARYGDVASDVKFELAKSRPFRVSYDEFLMKIQMKLDFLSATAPDL